jgi:lipoprotein-anchoring transpeptidase ErfK/SrfK
VLGFLLECALFAAGIGLAHVYRSDVILPGVRSLGVDLGGMTRQEAARKLRDAWNARSVTLDAGPDGTWTLSPEAAGLILDAEATTSRAYAIGRFPSTLSEFRDTVGRLAALGLAKPRTSRSLPSPSSPLASLPFASSSSAPASLPEVDAAWKLDAQSLAAALRPIADQLAVPVHDARVWIADGRVESSAASTGRSLDLAATLAWAEQHTDRLAAERRLPLVVVTTRPAVADVSAAVRQAEALLGRSVTVQLYDPMDDERLHWTADPKVIGGWLALRGEAWSVASGAFRGEASFWSVKREAVEAWVQEQAKALGAERCVDEEEAADAVAEAVSAGKPEIKLRVLHRERTHTVESGETIAGIATKYGIPYPWIQKANPGLGEMMYVGQKVTIPSADLLIPLPVVENKRIRVSISQQRMWAYENGAVKWVWLVSTGIPSSPTSPGVFQVQSHETNAYAASWNLWMPYFIGIYRPVPDHPFMNGFHGFPTRGSQQLLWTGNLGTPVTYGCILLSTDNALTLYRWAEEGVVVEVRP